jgi:CelD/BcsL family acetyltransferase involved in cellulose biosynthesis
MSETDDRVRCVNPLEDPAWDARLATLAGASFFHGSAWARVLHDTYGFTPAYLVTNRGGVLPLMEVKSWITGCRGVSLPFSDECGILCADDADLEALVHAAIQRAHDHRWNYWELRGGQSQPGATPASATYYGHTLDLDRDASALFSRLDSATRRAVRKAERSGVTVEVSPSLDAVRSFHRLLCQTRRRHGVPPQPFRFFANIQRHILARGQGCVLLARVHGAPVAGAVFFHSGRNALYKFGASDDAHQHLRPNNLIMWRAIESYAAAGYLRLDFGRTALAHEGLRRFKRGWGVREHRINYVNYDRRLRRFVSEKPSSSSWAGRMFKLLPAWCSRLVGAAAYKHAA